MRIRTMYDAGLVFQSRREKIGLTQQQLADKARVSRSWLAKVGTGKASFDFRKVLMVSQVLGMHVEINDD
ncbi:helix-turn-helix domain-containing protein [Bifidobacterium tibiigranuli]|uniref:helix-turn-helix domain-containing protein n=1 Tax=Bifidobacterium tibiigranuli TaxID=2172043 RepID=UPI0026ED8000|nr:helix-turn-helix domain-containing protein [Bifidobacterium tibiigranuli]MCI1649757.1 helix-turn-helix domain-containing protein [Bifidobacterium tibiigranuli]MCI2186652.1 helix-turn-helix domain-containing protein [Bifidobacterium tibiigranuli]MCI2204258.1 helix-turn-helix domain-containing protein [Bifidobacterium tibiigranuli]